MPIYVRTGKPGNGKTAFMMADLMAEAAKTGKDRRPLYASGIDGLAPGLANVIDDPRTWNDLDPNREPDCTCDKHPGPHAHVLPNGALWFVDEAWKWFGHLHSADRQASPLHVLALAEHRHRGIDMIWTTQGPNQLYPFARPLCDEHRHYVRKFGTKYVDVYTWQELQDDVKSPSKREAAQHETKALPEKSFGTYKSADQHTIKARIPLKVWALPALVIAAAVLAWVAYGHLSPDAVAAELAAEGTDAAPAAPAPADGSRPPGRERDEPRTVEEFVADLTPRIPTLPWSIPALDERKVQAEPEVYCMASGAGEDATGRSRPATVTCLTEQGTKFVMDERMARKFARDGAPYNPYRAPPRHTGAAPTAQGGGTAPTATASPGVVLGGPQVSGYGDLGIPQDG